jgi:hypothetical protein
MHFYDRSRWKTCSIVDNHYVSPPPTVDIEASDRDLSTSQYTHDNTPSHRYQDQPYL